MVRKTVAVLAAVLLGWMVLLGAPAHADVRSEDPDIAELKGEVTVISIAHRLSTIRDHDQLWFMRDGRIQAQGTFDEVVRLEPEFGEQARLAGLTR